MNKLVLLFSSVLGVGYIKYASGTFGSLAGILFWIFIPQDFQVIAVIGIIIASILFSDFAEKIYQEKDDGRIVIDEVAGMWVSLLFLPKTAIFFILGFLLFRFFDIKKPLFINKLQDIKGGMGITIDDVAAGIFVNIILQIIKVIKVLI